MRLRRRANPLERIGEQRRQLALMASSHWSLSASPMAQPVVDSALCLATSHPSKFDGPCSRSPMTRERAAPEDRRRGKPRDGGGGRMQRRKRKKGVKRGLRAEERRLGFSPNRAPPRLYTPSSQPRTVTQGRGLGMSKLSSAGSQIYRRWHDLSNTSRQHRELSVPQSLTGTAHPAWAPVVMESHGGSADAENMDTIYW